MMGVTVMLACCTPTGGLPQTAPHERGADSQLPASGDPIETARPSCPSDMVLVQIRDRASATDDETGTPAQARGLQAFCIDTFEFPNERGSLPMANVTWRQAKDLCVDKGKRLCRSAEWERACRGPDDRQFPYGDTFDRQACNTPLDAWPGDSFDMYAPSGSFPRCVTTEGVFDMDGSLSEWVDDEVTCPDAGGYADDVSCRIVRGGTMWDADYSHDCSSSHSHRDVQFFLDDGFRCCRDAAAAR